MTGVQTCALPIWIKMESMSDKEKAAVEKTIVRQLKRVMKIKGVRGKKLIE